MSEKILLIDGHSMMNRAFYGVPDLTNSAGVHTGAIYGFFNIILKILENERPQYFAVAFDEHAPTFRHKIYAEYKGTRKPMPEELRQQIPLVKEILSAMGVPVVSKPGLEADDILGTIAFRAEKKGMDATIVSGDRDLLQLVTDKIALLLPRTVKGQTNVERFTPEAVKEEYGVEPRGIIDLKALMGDSSDNIPGVPKVGPKTATELLTKYGDLKGVKEHIAEVTKKSIRESLEEHFDLAELSQTLATINTESDIEFDFDKAECESLGTAEAVKMLTDLELKKLVERLGGVETVVEEKTEFREITELSDAEALFNELAAKATVGFAVDISEENEISGIAFVADGAWYIEPAGFITSAYLADHLVKLINKSNGMFYTAHLKQVLKVADLPSRSNLVDYELEFYLLDPLRNDYAVPEKAQEAAVEAFENGPKYMERIEAEGMKELLENIEMPLCYVLSGMETEGIAIRKDMLTDFSAQLKEKIDKLEKSIHEAAGEDFNINSPKQLGVILFEKMGLKGGKKTKTGYSTAAGVLEKLAPEVPFVRDVLEYRTLSKLKATYADGLEPYIDKTGRIHSTFNQTITATGRISSADPNLQNIPVRTELGRTLRKAFVPREGWSFIDADYSQIELRILASMSEDQKLIAAYKGGKDIHAITASEVFHVPFEEVTSDLRRKAKAVNFGIVYGISAFGLSQGLSVSKSEANEYIEKYFETYPGVKKFLDDLVERAKDKGYAETFFSRKRPMPELRSSNFMQRSFGERVAMNAPIQGTAADVIKIAMINVSKRLKADGLQSKLILQIHDELLIETAPGEEEKVKEILREEMMGAASLAVPLEIDVNGGSNWDEAH
ncbi:DNA polymerase I [Lachnospiraceae bacterium KH1T2]|nr:DNA polymerase I [Lachnospiraceae bacterium KH1T2]